VPVGQGVKNLKKILFLTKVHEKTCAFLLIWTWGVGYLADGSFYAPGIDELVCIIEVADGNRIYYYHYDRLSSMVALETDGKDGKSFT
jgi:hypothetical protein